jgi:hypothetical protein
MSAPIVAFWKMLKKETKIDTIIDFQDKILHLPNILFYLQQ